MYFSSFLTPFSVLLFIKSVIQVSIMAIDPRVLTYADDL